MSTTPARVRANRANSLRSTGPRTPAGLARASQNALKVGLFARHLVLPALGETATDYDAFREAVVADLHPAGVVEAELADRVAGLTWRLRRVARYETAAMSAALGDLPPHPDTIEPLTGNEPFFPVPPGATTAFQLGHLRARVLGSGDAISSRRTAADALNPAADVRAPVALSAVVRVLDAAADELNWPFVPDPWPEMLTAAGIKRRRVSAVKWTVGQLNRVLKSAAGTAGRDGDEVRDAVRERLLRAAADLECAEAERRDEEARLVEELLQERERVAASRLLADESLIQRVARAESHLARELDRTLMMLAQRRAERAREPNLVRVGGFVLRNGVAPERHEVPASGTG